jgi:hypothetical protein
VSPRPYWKARGYEIGKGQFLSSRMRSWRLTAPGWAAEALLLARRATLGGNLVRIAVTRAEGLMTDNGPPCPQGQAWRSDEPKAAPCDPSSKPAPADAGLPGSVPARGCAAVPHTGKFHH